MYIKKFILLIYLFIVSLTLSSCTQHPILKNKVYIVKEEHTNIKIKNVDILESFGHNLTRSQAISCSYSILKKYFGILPNQLTQYDIYILYNNSKQRYEWYISLKDTYNNIFIVSIDTALGILREVDATSTNKFKDSSTLLSKKEILDILKNFFKVDNNNINLIKYYNKKYVSKAIVSINKITYVITIDSYSKKVTLIDREPNDI